VTSRPQPAPIGLIPLLAVFVALAAVIFAPGHATAQFGQQQTTGMFRFPASVSARVSPSVAFPGETVTVEVTLTIDQGHYTYSMVPPEKPGPVPTKADLDSLADSPLREIDGHDWVEPRPYNKRDAAFNMVVGTHAGTIVFTRQIRIAEGTEPGNYPVTGGLLVQICDETSCLPPRRLAFASEVMVRNPAGEGDPRVHERIIDTPDETAAQATPVATPEPSPTPEPTPEPTPVPTPEPISTTPDDTAAAVGATSATFGADRLVSGGSNLWGVIVASFIAGIFAILMPCVFPMIPITIAYFTKNAQKSTFKRVELCTIFSLSIVAGFALFGFGLAAMLYAAGRGAESAGFITQIASNPWLNTVLALLFVAFALSLFGLFEIALPSSIANKLQSAKGGRGDWLGAVLMAAIFVVVSFTCTVPIIGLLLPTIFTGEWYTPLVGMTVFAAAFALPFFFLGLAPQFIANMPKSGDWLNATKITMGLIEVAAALYYISKADMIWGWGFFTREFVFAGWAAVAVVTALYLLKAVKLAHDTDTPIGPMRLVTSVAFATLAVYFASGAFGRPLFSDLESLMPIQRSATGSVSIVASSGEGTKGASIKDHFIVNDLDRAKAIAAQTGKPLFIDFTGWTCTNCRLMEIDMFPRPRVRERLEQFVLVALFTDDPVHGERNQQLQIRDYGTLSLPYYVTMTAGGDKIATFGGLTRNESEFVEFLEYSLKGHANEVAMAQ
jgi:thiol:disulfide interchange protein